MKIINAGAGAGKTTKLSEMIKKQYGSQGDTLKEKEHIFVIAYSNYATQVISDRIIKQYNELPKNIHISTIHSFLWNFIIQPYYFLLFDQQFTEITNQSVGNDYKYRAKKLAELRKLGILHVSEFTKFAKKVLVGNKNCTKKEGKLRGNILNHLNSFIDAIFIDEAQDMDTDTAKCVDKLDKIGIKCCIVGDENQDLHAREGFSSLIKKYPEMLELEIKNNRCPSSHIALANRYISYNQVPRDNAENGTLKYALEKEIDMKLLFSKYSKAKIFINKSIREYQVHKGRMGNTEQLEYVIRKHHVKSKGYEDLNSIESRKWAFDCAKTVEKKLRDSGGSTQGITNHLISKLGLSYNSRLYAELINSIDPLTTVDDERASTVIFSVEAVKGAQSDYCILLMSTDLFRVLIGENKSNNSTTNALYVALTRSTRYLLIILTREVTNKYSDDYIHTVMEKLKVNYGSVND